MSKGLELHSRSRLGVDTVERDLIESAVANARRGESVAVRNRVALVAAVSFGAGGVGVQVTFAWGASLKDSEVRIEGASFGSRWGGGRGGDLAVNGELNVVVGDSAAPNAVSIAGTCRKDED